MILSILKTVKGDKVKNFSKIAHRVSGGVRI